MRVDFPDGQWAEIYSAAEMPRRVTARIEDMLAESPASQEGFAAMRSINRMRDTLMAMVVKQWSYDSERSGDSAEDMYDLPEASYDKLKEETVEHWRKAGFTVQEPEEKEGETEPTAKRRSPAKTTSSA
jgi:hypothetical protein